MLHEAQNIISPFSSLWLAMMDLFASASSLFLRRKKQIQELQLDRLHDACKSVARAWLQKYWSDGQAGRS
jgi:hypothetical protein